MQRRVLGLLYRTRHSFVSFQRSGEVGTRPAGVPGSSRVDCRSRSREPEHELLGTRRHPPGRSISALLLRLQLRQNDFGNRARNHPHSRSSRSRLSLDRSAAWSCNRGRAATSTQSIRPCFPMTTEPCGCRSVPTGAESSSCNSTRKPGKRLTPDAPFSSLAYNKSIEASCLYKHDGYYYLFVNWGSCCRGVNSTYNIRVGRSRKVTGPYIDKDGVDMLKAGGTLLLSNQGPLFGPGHAGILVDNGKSWFTSDFEGDSPDGRESNPRHHAAYLEIRLARGGGRRQMKGPRTWPGNFACQLEFPSESARQEEIRTCGDSHLLKMADWEQTWGAAARPAAPSKKHRTHQLASSHGRMCDRAEHIPMRRSIPGGS